MKKQYRSRILASVHETAKGLYEAGLMDNETMREFDENCLISAPEIATGEIWEIGEHGFDAIETEKPPTQQE